MGFQIQSIDLRFKFQEGGSLFVEDSSISWEKNLANDIRDSRKTCDQISLIINVSCF